MKWEGKIVEVYDLWWSPNTEKAVPFWCAATLTSLRDQQKNDRSARIVELCSGTGRVLVPVVRHLLKESPNVHVRALGLDYSKAMNAKLTQKLAGERDLASAITVKDFDIREEDWTSALGSEKVDVFLFPFNHFAQMGSPAAQESIVRKISSHLAPGGSLILEDYNPKGSRQRDTGEKLFRHTVADTANNQALFYWRRSWPLNPDHRYAQVLYVVECVEWVNDGLRLESLTATERIHYTEPEELDLLLTRHNLTVQARYSDYTETPFTERAERQLVIAKKR